MHSQRKTTEWDRLELSSENWRYEGNISCKNGHKKDRNGKDLTEAEEIKTRWQEYTGELYRKDPNATDIHNSVVTHREPEILECEITNKASGCDGIPVELFQILKDDAMKLLHSICQQIWKTQQ